MSWTRTRNTVTNFYSPTSQKHHQWPYSPDTTPCTLTLHGVDHLSFTPCNTSLLGRFSGLSLFWYLPLANVKIFKEKPLKRQRRLGLWSVIESKAKDRLVVQFLNILVFLTYGKRISLSMAVWDFSFSACLSHSRIKFCLKLSVNHCYIYRTSGTTFTTCTFISIL